ncbi:MAG: hypothetical protein K2L84_05155 [Muribaculaceae bacterium]|nr:hypothetical protein [Muribaculaceae bacterium]
MKTDRLISSITRSGVEMPEHGRRFFWRGVLMRNTRCIVCGEPVHDGRNISVDDYNSVSCASHAPERCFVCNRFIIGSRVVVQGYGYACKECGTPRSYAELEKVRLSINAFYAKLHMFIPGYRLVLLPGQTMLDKYVRYFDVPPLGAAWKEDGNPDYGYRVDIMSQQSVISMSSTLAHELLHLWQFYRGLEAPTPYAEGFCNLGAFLYVSTLNEDEALVNMSRMMENRDADYGVAFRRLKLLYDMYGWDAVVKAMKETWS